MDENRIVMIEHVVSQDIEEKADILPFGGGMGCGSACVGIICF